MNEWIWILLSVFVLSGIIIFAQYQPKQPKQLESAVGDLSFGSAIINHKGTVYVSAPMLSNESGAVFEVSNLTKKKSEFGKVGEQFGSKLFTDQSTRTILSKGLVIRNERESQGAVTFNGAYNGEISGFPQSPDYAITIKDQTLVSVGTKIYVYQHLTRNTHYLSYIFEARAISLDGFVDRICWRTNSTCTVLTKQTDKETWEKTMEFPTNADQVSVSSTYVYGVNNGILYTYIPDDEGKVVAESLSTGLNGYTRLAWDSTRSFLYVAVDDGQIIKIFRYNGTKFDSTGTCYQTGLIDFAVTSTNNVIVSSDFNIYSVDLYADDSKFVTASQI